MIFAVSDVAVNSFYYQLSVDIFCHSLCDYSDFCKMNARLRHQARTYVRKVIGHSGTVASGTMGEQRGTPTPVELHWIGSLF